MEKFPSSTERWQKLYKKYLKSLPHPNIPESVWKIITSDNKKSWN